MKTLIVDDDSTCQLLLQEILKNYGQCHVAVDGREVVEAVRVALGVAAPYDPIGRRRWTAISVSRRSELWRQPGKAAHPTVRRS